MAAWAAVSTPLPTQSQPAARTWAVISATRARRSASPSMPSSRPIRSLTIRSGSWRRSLVSSPS